MAKKSKAWIRDKNFANNIIAASEGLDFFWYSLHTKRETAERRSKMLNRVLKGTGAEASIDFARNYNPKGIDWGVVIVKFTPTAEALLKAKYKLN